LKEKKKKRTTSCCSSSFLRETMGACAESNS
jgi:hypothetical protein